ncbi:hypothetical protein ACFV60_23960 [Streptomyces virginiae]|uniref:hypothetical protein n=2 Tax=Streptomyces TaxID=1883 RepID=UPI00365BC77F
MSSPKRSKTPAVEPDQVVELYGPENEGWYDTRVMDWIALCDQLKDGEVRGYLVLRSLVIDKFHNHVRVLTLQLLCELIPSPSGGPSSLTRVRSILDGLTKVGLVTTPEGKPIKTSSRASAIVKPLRIRINDAAPEGYAGWRNTETKLKALGTALAELVEESPRDASAAADKEASKAGRKSDPVGEAGRISDPPGRISDPRSRISDPDTVGDLEERDLPLVSSSGFSLSPAPSITSAPSAPAEAGTERRGENSASLEETTPAPVAAGALAVTSVVEAWTTGLKAGGRPPLPKRAAAIGLEVAELLEAGHSMEHLCRVAEWMGRMKPSWKSVEDAMTWPEAPQASLPKQRSGPAMCERHPAFEEGDCAPCRLAERERRQRQGSEPAAVNGADLLARLRAGQPA